jgi:MerR family transcriptional regulator, light-induced transcriptional regulator
MSGEPRPGKSRAILARAIEAEVLPRMVLAQRAIALSSLVAKNEFPSPGAAEVSEFAALALSREVDALSAYVDSMRASGASLEQVYLYLIGPTARRLEDLGTGDLFALTHATIGLGRLQRLLHRLNPAFETEGEPKSHGRHALIMPALGEQNTFDLFIVGAWLRRAGWEVSCWPLIPSTELFDAVRREPFALVWLSARCENRIDALSAIIRRVRRASQNPDIGVMVGGPLFAKRPALVALVGADATAADGKQAALQAQNLVDLLLTRLSDRFDCQPSAARTSGVRPRKFELTGESVPG